MAGSGVQGSCWLAAGMPLRAADHTRKRKCTASLLLPPCSVKLFVGRVLVTAFLGVLSGGSTQLDGCNANTGLSSPVDAALSRLLLHALPRGCNECTGPQASNTCLQGRPSLLDPGPACCPPLHLCCSHRVHPGLHFARGPLVLMRCLGGGRVSRLVQGDGVSGVRTQAGQLNASYRF